MSFFFRSFAGYLLLIALAAFFGVRIAQNELKPAMRQAVEELLIDCANLLAEVASTGSVARTHTTTPAEQAQPSQLIDAYQHFAQRKFHAHVYDVPKSSPDLRLYLTDTQGRVIFDSVPANIGTDFSQWNDVLRTLRGDYGARATRADPGNPASTVLFVAAPIRIAGKLAGVLSLGKSNLSLEPFIERSRNKLLQAGSTLVAAAIAIALALSWWVSYDLRRLSQYARDASAGKRVPAPRYRGGELATLSSSLAQMRSELEGKAHIEQFAQLLTHELKSPLAAIQGAADLLEEEMLAADRQRFVANIRAQTTHMQALVERLMHLAILENRQTLEQPESMALHALCSDVVRTRSSAIDAKHIKVDIQVDTHARLHGESMLLQQALLNLLDNAIAFSLPNGRIEISHTQSDAFDTIRVRDHGVGLPTYALPRLFERFYSLPRPDTGVKSTGLGLLLVREVAALHGGGVELRNHPQGGVEGTLQIARSPVPELVR